MGVPALFRWLSERYPKIVNTVVEEEPQTINGVTIPIDITQPNPNGVEFDNLYLDLNGIVHPCCHPTDKPAPETEEDMMLEIFKYLDRIMCMIRPRKLLYIAIDGVAPRAKMNQQRSRRFRAGLEARTLKAKEEENDAKKRKTDSDSASVEKKEHFDSNCITPGTPFMDKLSNCLKYYIADKLNNDIHWRNLNVIFSDASYPGEGEHKIMDYIRRMRNSPGHDPNTQHVLYGLDADLIMLSLATHEPHFKVLREDVNFGNKKSDSSCRNCGGSGHYASSCTVPKNEVKPKAEGLKPFVLLHINVLREYLEVELKCHNLTFGYDLENAIDDWIFLIFFVGNDFLPHLPTLNIREKAIDKLIKMWKNSLNEMGGFMTKAGEVNLERVQVILTQLGEMEEGVFHDRKVRQDRMNQRNARNNPQQFSDTSKVDASNKNAALELKAFLSNSSKPDGKRSRDDLDNENTSKKTTKVEPVKEDPYIDGDVAMGEPGYKERYYLAKFGVPETDKEFPAKVATAYIEGLCWVLKYYYQGCSSWRWFYPYHYPPFASDFVGMDKLKFNFELGKPLKPFEQLMGVLPADSKQHLPEPFHFLMEDPESPIIDFYPLNFKLDLNGAKMPWLAVVLLPFIEEKRLLGAIEQVYPELTPDEHRRNSKGHELLFVSQHNPLYQEFIQLFTGNANEIIIDPELSRGITGSAKKDSNCKPNETFHTPLLGKGPLDISNDTSLSVRFSMPDFPEGFIFPCELLPGVKLPPKVLSKGDVDVLMNGGTRNFGRHDYQRHEYYKGRESYEHKTHNDLVQDGFIDNRNAPEGYNRFYPSGQSQPRPRYNDNFANFQGGHNQRGYNAGQPNFGYEFAPYGGQNNNHGHQPRGYNNQYRPRGQGPHQYNSHPRGPPQIMPHSQAPPQVISHTQRPGHNPNYRGNSNRGYGSRGRGY